MKKIGKRIKDPELNDYCEACLRIRNGIFDPTVNLKKNDVPHTCCGNDEESSNERIGIDIEIAELLKIFEDGFYKNGMVK